MINDRVTVLLAILIVHGLYLSNDILLALIGYWFLKNIKHNINRPSLFISPESIHSKTGLYLNNNITNYIPIFSQILIKNISFFFRIERFRAITGFGSS